MTDLDFYLNFLLHAILGRLGEADALMTMAGDDIRAVANRLAAKHPITTAPLYRGLLLVPGEPYAAEPKITFLSWSEDRDVALWFACPRSAVSEPLAKVKPSARGHLIELPALQPNTRILFHHSWSDALGGLSALALAHPLMGAEGQRQIAWSLRTQREVITEPIDDLHPERVPDLDAETLAALERRLSPPWVVAAEGLRT